MSIPIVFEPTSIKKLVGGKPQDAGVGAFVDGGLLDNYPIEKFDKKGYKTGFIPDSSHDRSWDNPYTWGLNLISKESTPPCYVQTSYHRHRYKKRHIRLHRNLCRYPGHFAKKQPFDYFSDHRY